MKRVLLSILAALSLLVLGGCATTVRSNVTTFHQWPAQVQDRSYSFEPVAIHDDTLEYRAYQDMVRRELATLGFTENSGGGALKVSMRFITTDVPVRVLQFAHPYYYTDMRFGFYRPFRRGYWGWHSPFYDPFYWGHPTFEETIQHHYKRELQVSIKSARDNARLFDVTVRNTSRTASTPAIMPALVHSAFVGFPGPSGQSRTVELELKG
jgi:hypothetical protein